MIFFEEKEKIIMYVEILLLKLAKQLTRFGPIYYSKIERLREELTNKEKIIKGDPKKKYTSNTTKRRTIYFLLYIILLPFNLVINFLRKLYYSVNWTVLLTCILSIELIVIGLIWT